MQWGFPGGRVISHPGLFRTVPVMKIRVCVRGRTLVTQSCLTLCDPMDCGLLGSSIHAILQARILEWVAISFSRGSSPLRDATHVSCISCTGRRVLYHWCHLGSPVIPCSVTQSCPTLCDPLDFSLPGSSVHGILQATILEWVAK